MILRLDLCRHEVINCPIGNDRREGIASAFAVDSWPHRERHEELRIERLEGAQSEGRCQAGTSPALYLRRSSLAVDSPHLVPPYLVPACGRVLLSRSFLPSSLVRPLAAPAVVRVGQRSRLI